MRGHPIRDSLEENRHPNCPLQLVEFNKQALTFAPRRTLVCIKIPRRDKQEGGEDEVTVTSTPHIQEQHLSI